MAQTYTAAVGMGVTLVLVVLLGVAAGAPACPAVTWPVFDGQGCTRGRLTVHGIGRTVKNASFTNGSGTVSSYVQLRLLFVSLPSTMLTLCFA